MKKGLGAGIGFVGVLWIVIRLIRAGMTYSDIENREIAIENAKHRKELEKLVPELIEMKILDSTIENLPVFHCLFSVDDSLDENFNGRVANVIYDIIDEEIDFQLPEPPFLGMSEYEIHGRSFSRKYDFIKVNRNEKFPYLLTRDSISWKLNEQYQ